MIYLNLAQAKREKIKQQNLVKRQNQMKLAKMDLEFKVFENLAGYFAMQRNDNTKKTPGSSSSCPCWCDCGWDSSSRPLSIFRFSTYHSHLLSTCSQDLGRMRKVVAMSSSRTSLDIGFSLKMDRRAFVNLNLYVVFYWSSVCKRVVCFSLSYVLSVKLCGKKCKNLHKRSSML